MSEHEEGYVDVDKIMENVKFLYQTYSINKPQLYSLMTSISNIAIEIGEIMGETSGEFQIACYTANLGLLASDGMEYVENMDKGKMEFYKKHATRSSDQIREIGLVKLIEKGHKDISEIVENHHEKPNGTGFFKRVYYPIESNFIRIADEFSTLTRPNARRMNAAYHKKEAARMVLKDFDGYETIISIEKKKEIFEYLVNLK